MRSATEPMIEVMAATNGERTGLEPLRLWVGSARRSDPALLVIESHRRARLMPAMLGIHAARVVCDGGPARVVVPLDK
jgi:hypothetical protein